MVVQFVAKVGVELSADILKQGFFDGIGQRDGDKIALNSKVPPEQLIFCRLIFS